MADITLQQVRSVPWRKSYLWRVFFPRESTFAKAPFNGWVPAVSVTENMSSLESYDFTAGPSSYKVPSRSSVFTIQLSFLEDESLTVTNFFRKWVNERVLLEDGLLVNYMQESVTPILIQKINSQHQVLQSSAYEVYPEGELFFEGAGDSSSPEIQVTLIVTKIFYQNEVSGGSTPTQNRGVFLERGGARAIPLNSIR